MSKRSLSRQSQGVRQYLNLKKDFEEKDDDISLSLPRFARIMFFDKNPSAWIDEINRFDLVRNAAVHVKFGTISNHCSSKCAYSCFIYSDGSEQIEVSLDSFFDKEILEINSKRYTIKDFILSIGYNGVIHKNPDKTNEHYNQIYKDFLNPFPDPAFDLMFEIANVLLDIFNVFYKMMLGSKNAESHNKNSQPLLIKIGKLLDGIYYQNYFLQVPLRHKKNKGIRICLDLKLEKLCKDNIILECGHTKPNSLKLRLLVNDGHLVFSVFGEKNNKTLSAKIANNIGSYFNIELAIYPNGKAILAINGILKDTADIDGMISIPDGKLIIGSNLNASDFGEFYNNTLVIQSIDSYNDLRNLNVFGNKILNFRNKNIRYNEIKRPFP